MALTAGLGTNRPYKVSSSCSFVHETPQPTPQKRKLPDMVALPRGYSESHAKYPVLYVLDAIGLSLSRGIRWLYGDLAPKP